MRVAGKIIIAGLSVLIALYLLKVALSVGLVAVVDLGTAGGQVGNGVATSFMVYYVGPVACATRVLRFEQPPPRCRYEDDLVFARHAFRLPPAPTS